MVSLFTLGVSFLAGVYFALGGYWNMLLGAILSVFASILDGCDGEVARLKLQESDFGCWLETICDQPLLFVYLRGHDDRIDEELRHENLSGMGWATSFRSDPKLPRHRPPTASADQWTS